MAKNKENKENMSVEQLQELVIAEKARYTRMKFNHAVAPIDNPMDLRFLRRNIAKTMTALQAKKNAK